MSIVPASAAFHWFIITVVGLMLRSDQLGVTSVVRDLALQPRYYESLIYFFRSSAWSLNPCVSPGSIWFTSGLHSWRWMGDGIKRTKEGRRMPGVKKMYSVSENSSRGEYIFGHLFGAIAVLAGNCAKWCALRLFTNHQDGVKTIWTGRQPKHALEVHSHVAKMIG